MLWFTFDVIFETIPVLCQLLGNNWKNSPKAPSELNWYEPFFLLDPDTNTCINVLAAPHTIGLTQLCQGLSSFNATMGSGFIFFFAWPQWVWVLSKLFTWQSCSIQVKIFWGYQKLSESKVLLKFKNKGISFSDIFWSKQNWVSYGAFVESVCTHLAWPQCLAVHSVYFYLAPVWPQNCQPITEEHRVICFALIGPIDGELPSLDHVKSVTKGPR